MNFDAQYFTQDFLIGCDEVGRGPLAGPVVAAAVYCDDSKALAVLHELGVTDSKKLSVKKRKLIFERLNIELGSIIIDKSFELIPGLHFCISELSEKVIDEINILKASLLAMQTASLKLLPKNKEGRLLIDGNKSFDFPVSTFPIVKGDSKSLLIGLASILAKEFRDEKMKAFDEVYPGYNFASHAGYPTAKHRSAIARIGVSPIHRKTFKGVKEFIKSAGI